MKRILSGAPVLVLAVLLAGFCLAAEGVPAGPDRFTLLVEGLDTGSRERAEVLGHIDNELRGPDAGEMHAALLEGLADGGLLMQLGAAEALARHADPRDLPLFKTVLESSDRAVVKVAMLRFLPAFALGNSERARFAYIRAVADGDGRRSAAATEPLSRPPLTRRGRLDMDLARLRREISSVVVGQFDPVGSAIAVIDNPRFGGQARNAVRKYVGGALGVDPGRWSEIWGAHSLDMPLLHVDELEEIATTALQALGGMGLPADGAAFVEIERLFAMENPLVSQAALGTLAAMCESATQTTGAFLDGVYGGDWTEAERDWLLEREGRAAELWLFAAREGSGMLDSADPALVRAAVRCLGAAVGFPSGVGERRPELAAMTAAAVGRLETMALFAGLDAGMRGDILKALGKSKTGTALSAILEIMNSPYAGPESGRDGLTVVEAGVGAVMEIALGSGDGARDARDAIMALLADAREYPAASASAPPVTVGHVALWRLQRTAKSSEISFDPGFWRRRLGWE